MGDPDIGHCPTKYTPQGVWDNFAARHGGRGKTLEMMHSSFGSHPCQKMGRRVSTSLPAADRTTWCLWWASGQASFVLKGSPHRQFWQRWQQQKSSPFWSSFPFPISKSGIRIPAEKENQNQLFLVSLEVRRNRNICFKPSLVYNILEIQIQIII